MASQQQKISLKKINKNLKAGKKFPLTIIVYSPFLKSGKLEYETEQYLKKEKIKLFYANSPQGLKKILKKLQ